KACPCCQTRQTIGNLASLSLTHNPQLFLSCLARCSSTPPDNCLITYLLSFVSLTLYLVCCGFTLPPAHPLLTQNAKLCLHSLFDQEKLEALLEYFKVAVGVLSTGAASGLNVIAVYVSEILSATGVSVKLPFPHFTAEGIAFVAQWALLAVIGYWVFSLVLHLVLCLLRRVLWLLKLSIALWLFVVIVSDTSANTNTTAWRLSALVFACALLGLARVGSEQDKSSNLERRVKGLEGSMKRIERNLKQ
uniref:Si:dkey-74k8.3 n=1 Tax=Paramormyrops kingsleyae TaxID=1676925 RepID=A0A3B3Q6M9_9TELE